MKLTNIFPCQIHLFACTTIVLYACIYVIYKVLKE